MSVEIEGKEQRGAEPESYRHLIEREWADVHHSRIQEWSALGVVTGVHLGIVHLLDMISETSLAVPFPTVVAMGASLALLFALIGSLMTMRHRHLMFVKLSWIYAAECELGLVKTSSNPGGVIPENAGLARKQGWNGLRFPRFLSSSWLMLCFYSVLALLDILSMVVVGHLP